MSSMLNCYSHYSSTKEECKVCEYVAWCKDAANPSVGNHINYDNVEFAEDVATTAEDAVIDAIEPTVPRSARPIYTADHLRALAQTLLAIEDRVIRELLMTKTSNPDITLSQIARRHGVSKQMIHKRIASAIALWPALEVILCNRPQYNKWRPKKRAPAASYLKRRKSTKPNPSQMEFKF